MLSALDNRFITALVMLYQIGFKKEAKEQAQAFCRDGWTPEGVREARKQALVTVLGPIDGNVWSAPQNALQGVPVGIYEIEG